MRKMERAQIPSVIGGIFHSRSIRHSHNEKKVGEISKPKIKTPLSQNYGIPQP